MDGNIFLCIELAFIFVNLLLCNFTLLNHELTARERLKGLKCFYIE